ncbi:MAG: Na+/H+ antiporter subunit E [Motiliproteus sp.]
MYYPTIAFTLYLFWLLLSGYVQPLLLGLGALSVLWAVWLARRMDRVDREPGFIPAAPGLFGYGLWLLWSVVKSNIDVARRIWTPSLPIHPNWRRLETRLSTPLQKTLFANSITLTPGTLTTDVNADHLIVHCLSEGICSELHQGEMERRIERLGI